MTRTEYQELVEFLGKRFGRVDGRFDGIEGRLTRVEVTVEENRHLIQTVAEGLTAHRESTEREFAVVRAEMAEGFSSVRTELRAEMAKGLGAVRSEMAEGFSSVRTELRAEMAEGLAAVRSEMAEGFAAVRSEMTEGFAAVRSEMAAGFRAQGHLIRDLGRRVDRLERRPV